jgi:DNA-binding GntR family transcriptional regulator
VARLAIDRASEADLLMLEQHLRLEEAAHVNRHRRDAIRLSGQFHVHLAQIAANSVMLRMVKELVTRTSLIIGLFGRTGVSNCRDEDHAEILEAFRGGDADRAARLMKSHLEHIQEGLDLGGRTDTPMDLVSLFKR